ncbi:MAG TPA: DUF1572 family protein [Chryseosolibacter sp.]
MKDFLSGTRKLFQHYKSMGEKAIDQLGDEHINWRPNEASNSVALIVHHLSGNMLSRFTDFLTSDGEKPWRDRDAEFETGYASKAEMMQAWENGWAKVFEAIDSAGEKDLEKVVYIRNEGHTVMDALQRQLAHYASHIGQILYIAKIIRGKDWKSLSIPKGQSGTFNQAKFQQEKTVRHFTDKA